MSEQLQRLNELNPIAKELRERQEDIESKLAKWRGITTDLILDAAAQGRAILLAKTKLGKHLKWSEWLGAHVPNLSEEQAAKYERVATEQLSGLRQCWFIFVPPELREQQPKRLPPASWEVVAGLTIKLTPLFDDMDAWPDEQRKLARDSFLPIVKRLWPEKF